MRNLLYNPICEHGSCGAGFVADTSGRRSHKILQKGIESVINLTHRGAVDADAKSGDGAGILAQIPYKLFLKELGRLGYRVEKPQDLAVGMVFFPQDSGSREKCQRIIEKIITTYGFRLFGWRATPVHKDALGDKARETQPEIRQLLLGRPPDLSDEEYERKLYLARKEIEGQIRRETPCPFYIPSLSHRTIVYKGLFVAPQLPLFYQDLQDPDFETALVLFHQRYSTNTFPNWFLAQPFRMLAHNGEINTLQGNLNWIRAREPELRSEAWGNNIEKIKPIVVPGGSDSASVDNVLEALVLSGRGILHAMMMLIPEAWQNMPHMDPDLRAFYEYHACLIEPWDGPAAISFTDGIVVGATLDRNGLRPARYILTDSGILYVASEAGVVEIDDREIIKKGQLGPGKMIAVDTERGTLLTDEEIKRQMTKRRPYRKWISTHLKWIQSPLPASEESFPPPDSDHLLQQQKVFGYTGEELSMIIKPMATEGKDPVFSMGDDSPLAALTLHSRLLYTYFKQRFAQVTNPPIDPIRENLVMSLNTGLGVRFSIFEETEEAARLIKFASPILFDWEMKRIRDISDPAFSSITLPALFNSSEGPDGVEKALSALCDSACQAIDRGHSILTLSDRGVDERKAPIPMLLAIGAVHHHLIREGRRMRASLIAETGEARDIHHFATLIGYGASAVYPYLPYETIRTLRQNGEIDGSDWIQGCKKFKKAVDNGLLKIMSKMGISTISSYRGAQIFEIIGISDQVVERCFTGTSSQIGGIGFREIAGEILARHRAVFGERKRLRLDHGGYYKHRKGGESHAFNPTMVKLIQKATAERDYEKYKKYAILVNKREPLSLRDLLEFRPTTSISIDEVEPVESIIRRFTTSGMSHGALSREAHETLAIAMNRMGAMSGSGEGGEDPARYRPQENGDSTNSKVKQVASGRFGVTPEYLISAGEIEIKMAQGSKPGEGGQLPGHKVTPEIASIRYTQPGVTLISPPPHHDIYSIEDLAQLIYDMKQINPRARVSVKLVSEAGVGTIAAGVAKAYADSILISGHDGGTGASPLSSIKNAGSPWEIGLAETQQVLMMNDLRGRVTIRVDGGMKTGRDVIIAAMLGGEEFTFGSIALVTVGCVMTRQCHLNTCPVGVATQDPTLRAKFTGTPEMVINFFTFIAQEVREILAQLGYRTLNEIIGRADLLVPAISPDHQKAHFLDLSRILAQADPTGTRPRFHTIERNNRVDTPLDETIIREAQAALNGNGPVRLSYSIRNTNRTVGARLAGEIVRRYGIPGLAEGSIEILFRGSAGQSFGAFCTGGMRLILIGEANDYVGKGMAGGEIIIIPPENASFPSHENTIIGNTVMYGATGGTLYAAGCAGERFCVRNSGGRAVVEGVGDHGCEYMTGGTVAVLGKTGRNFGAGMTGGVTFVLDDADLFPMRHNPESVHLERVTEPRDQETLHALIRRHQDLTRSKRADTILEKWGYYLPLFWKVVPNPAEAKTKTPLPSSVIEKTATPTR